VRAIFEFMINQLFISYVNCSQVLALVVEGKIQGLESLLIRQISKKIRRIKENQTNQKISTKIKEIKENQSGIKNYQKFHREGCNTKI
jgi:hypothetical protein